MSNKSTKSRPQRKPRDNRNINDIATVTRENTEPTAKVEVNFANLKRETDEIKKLTETKSFSKRQISSNWEKYKQIEDDKDDFVAADFSSLLQAPIAEGGHFQFKTEKDWNVKVDSKYSDYFSLDLKTITNGILSIPFYERFDIDTSLLTSNQISVMTNQAIPYQNKLKKSKLIKNERVSNKLEKSLSNQDIIKNKEQKENIIGHEEQKLDITENEEPNEDIIEEEFAANNTEENIEDLNSKILDIDDLLELNYEETKKTEQKLTGNELKNKISDLDLNSSRSIDIRTKPSSSAQDDLEQWLDNILDD